MTKYVRPATAADLAPIAAGLRQEDIDEIMAGRGLAPLPALAYGLAVSDPCYVLGTAEDPYCGLMGVSKTFVEGAGGIWMVATEALVKHQIKFLRGCFGVLEELHDRHPVLWNCVDERNEAHIRWLRWLGFIFIMRHPYYGVEQRPFLEFVRIK